MFDSSLLPLLAAVPLTIRPLQSPLHQLSDLAITALSVAQAVLLFVFTQLPDHLEHLPHRCSPFPSEAKLMIARAKSCN